MDRRAAREPGPSPGHDAARVLAHRCVRASAGSGKTHELTSRYVRLVLEGVDPATILASTFTRAAAAEIRARVLGRLVDALRDEGALRALAGAVQRPGLEREEVHGALERLVESLDRLQIRTLDGFLASIVTGFAAELGVPPGSAIGDESRLAELRDLALEAVLEDLGPDDAAELLRRITMGADDRAVDRSLRRTVLELAALHEESDDEAWTRVPPAVAAPGSTLEADLERCAAAPVPDTKTALKAHAQTLAAARAGDWDAVIGKGIGTKVLAGEGTFGRRELDGETIAAYEALLERARAVLVGRLRDQNDATRRLLERHRQHLLELKRRQRQLAFDDLPALVRRSRRLGHFERIAFRLDAQLRHLLLDEFQDTSTAQWAALEPLVIERLATGWPDSSFFCVGDTKQSIYTWRDAAPEILDRLPTLMMHPDGGTAMELGTLRTSWRSSSVVIDTVNAVFGSLEDNPALAEHAEARDLWRADFQPHETARDLPGVTELRTAIEPAGADERARGEARRRTAATLIEDLHRRMPGATIGVLTRGNALAGHLLHDLGPDGPGLPVSGRGGATLTGSAPVLLVLDALRLADRPGDSAAAFHVLTSPLGPALSGDAGAWASPERRERVAERIRASLHRRGPERVLGDWIAELAPLCSERDLRHLLRLAELADRHRDQVLERPASLIALAEAETIGDAAATPIRVMTIHQSKGLEFDLVVLPELGARLVGTRPPAAYVQRTGDIGPVEIITRPGDRATRAVAPTMTPLVERHARRAARESLALLYVAMTRAEHGLWMIVDARPDRTGADLGPTLAGVVTGALAGHRSLEPDTVLHAHGSVEGVRERFEHRPEPPPPIRPVGPPPLRSGPRRTGSRPAEPPSASPAAGDARTIELGLPNDEALDRGTAMHLVMQSIEWLDDHPLAADDAAVADDAVEAMVRTIRGQLRHRGGDWARLRVREAVAGASAEGLRAWLRRGDRDPARVRVLREHPFVTRTARGLQQGVVDRIELVLDGTGRPRRAIVLDYKTDRLRDRPAAEVAETHRSQLDVYRDRVGRSFGLDPADPETVEAVVIFLHEGVAVRLDP